MQPALLRLPQSGTLRLARLALALVAFSLLIGLALPGRLAAQEPPPPANVEALLKLLADPDVQKWLGEQGKSRALPAAQTPSDPRPAASLALERIRNHVSKALGAVPGIPAALARAWQRLSQDVSGIGGYRAAGISLLVALLATIGGLYWRRRLEPVRRRLTMLPPPDASVRVRTALKLAAVDLGAPAAFAIAGIAAVLLLDLSPLFKDLLLIWLLAAAAALLFSVLLAIVLRPSRPAHPSLDVEYRLLPLRDASAAFHARWLTIAFALLAFGIGMANTVNLLGVAQEMRQDISYLVGLVLLAVMLFVVWGAPAEEAASLPPRPKMRSWQPWLLSFGMLLLWLFWAASAMRLFWLVAVCVLLPLGVRATRRMVNHVMREPEGADQGAPAHSIVGVCLERGLRVLLIVGAVVLVAWAWEIDLVRLMATDTFSTRILRGAMSAVVIVLAADFLWQIAKALLDRQLVQAQSLGAPGTPEARRAARLRTLLPIVRNILFVVLAAMAVLMALASLGVEIGPLIAGAGVVGVAVGFGAQTLVKDIISGMFYLLDDAFRVGEYIESGKFKGTVESFSLRSVKLRHHRGPVFTVPFGELGAIQNMSRDWVVEKIVLGITYDSDVEKARKIIKKIGLELAEDPEFKDSTIEPLKMQGVENFGDFAIQIRLKLKTKPGEQFGIKRRAYMMIKQAFAENGIKFAYPTVQVAGAASPEAAAASAAQGSAVLAPTPAA